MVSRNHPLNVHIFSYVCSCLSLPSQTGRYVSPLKCYALTPFLSDYKLCLPPSEVCSMHQCACPNNRLVALATHDVQQTHFKDTHVTFFTTHLIYTTRRPLSFTIITTYNDIEHSLQSLRCQKFATTTRHAYPAVHNAFSTSFLYPVARFTILRTMSKTPALVRAA